MKNSGPKIGTSFEALLRKSLIEKDLEGIGESLKKEKVLSKLNVLIDQEKHEKDQAKKILSPDNNFNEQTSVEKWFQSDVWADINERMSKVYDEAMMKNSITSADFLEFGLTTRFILSK